MAALKLEQEEADAEKEMLLLEQQMELDAERQHKAELAKQLTRTVVRPSRGYLYGSLDTISSCGIEQMKQLVATDTEGDEACC